MRIFPNEKEPRNSSSFSQKGLNRGRGRIRKIHAFARRGRGEGDAKEKKDSSFTGNSIPGKCDRNMLKNETYCVKEESAGNNCVFFAIVLH